MKPVASNPMTRISRLPLKQQQAGLWFLGQAGYMLRAGGCTHYSELLLECAPQAEVLLVCINGKWGKLNPDQAARLADKVVPRFAIPNHYDLMALNAENPKTFEYFLQQRNPHIATQILRVLETFVWS
jgi:L-ascorbate metabolism protein UlaG (beta-lactamase superfamily)